MTKCTRYTKGKACGLTIPGKALISTLKLRPIIQVKVNHTTTFLLA